MNLSDRKETGIMNLPDRKETGILFFDNLPLELRCRDVNTALRFFGVLMSYDFICFDFYRFVGITRDGREVLLDESDFSVNKITCFHFKGANDKRLKNLVLWFKDGSTFNYTYNNYTTIYRETHQHEFYIRNG